MSDWITWRTRDGRTGRFRRGVAASRGSPFDALRARLGLPEGTAPQAVVDTVAARLAVAAAPSAPRLAVVPSAPAPPPGALAAPGGPALAALPQDQLEDVLLFGRPALAWAAQGEPARRHSSAATPSPSRQPGGPAAASVATPAPAAGPPRFTAWVSTPPTLPPCRPRSARWRADRGAVHRLVSRFGGSDDASAAFELETVGELELAAQARRAVNEAEGEAQRAWLATFQANATAHAADLAGRADQTRVAEDAARAEASTAYDRRHRREG